MSGGRGPSEEPARARGAGKEAAPSGGARARPGSNAAAPRSLLPAIELPTGGGAIRGIGEKLAANPATGTSSLTVPLAISPGRGGFAVALSLAYDSGSGSGPFGLGWHVSIPAITRKTEKGLPRYRDDEPDVFVLSGAEDLVPVRTEAFDRDDHRVVRYRPRTEGLFARIEQWTDRTSGEVHWRAITRDNVTSTYGATPDARIADPDDRRRVFSWLLEETRDDRGNVARYKYSAEDGDGVERGEACEAHRFAADGTFRAIAQRYPKRVLYGNRTPGVAADWMFEAVFDYGEHDSLAPGPDDDAPRWPVRSDPFSSYRAGFEVRTYRLCRRVLMFHRFAELGAAPCLVRSTDFSYEEGPSVTYLRRVVHSGYVRSASGGYDRAEVPALELDYARPELRDSLAWLDPASLEGMPGGVDAGMQWVDLEGEGLPGVLHAGDRGWTYKRNLGEGVLAAPAPLRSLPVPAALGAQQLVDLDGDGRLELAQYAPPLAGYFTRTTDGDWAPFVALRELPNLAWNDPNLRFVDLDGDGHADVLITEDDVFVWYRSRGTEGFAAPAIVAKPSDEARGPAVVFATGVETIQLADLSGDGLVDLVRVRSGEVCYWPNLGHGRFGAKVTFSHAPSFDAADLFDARRVRFADLDGSGTSDLFYLRRDGVDIYWNHAGNRISEPHRIGSLPPVDTNASVTVVDLLGQGTSCLVWSSPSPATAPLAYVDLLGGMKPHLLNRVDNGMGGETRIAYAPSTRFYLADQRAGRAWLTRLPFPVHLVESVEYRDRIAGSTLLTRYAYHHGFFDGVEREFRGFAFVEQWDAEAFTGTDLHLAPTHTKTWFHTGAWLERERFELALAREYYDRDPLAPVVPATILPAGLTVREEREAARALRGLVLRQEVFADDDTPACLHPYAVTDHAYEVRVEQRSSGTGERRVPAVCFAHPRHTIAHHYERRSDDPRTSFEVVLDVDAFGTVTSQAAIVAPRRAPAEPEQARAWATVTERRVANRATERDWYRIGVPVEETTVELTGLVVAVGAVPTVIDIRAALAAPDVPFHAPVGADVPGYRMIACGRHLYYNAAASAALPLGEIAPLALPYESYRLALTPALVTAVYGTRVDDRMLRDDGHYLDWDGAWWSPSGRVEYDPARFYVPVRAIDPFGAVHTATYDAHTLVVVDTEDPVGNHVTAVFDYRVLGPVLVTDPNRNQTAARHDALGMVVATAAMGRAGEGSSLDEPTTRIEYDLHAWRARGEPACAHVIAREAYRGPTRLQHSYHYTDGSGREAMIKVQAEGQRWVGTGRTVFDNKSNPVKKYEPYFSSTPGYETETSLVASGVTAILRYDPLSRLVRTDFPDGTHARANFDAWRQETWDPCDTIAGTPWLAAKQAGGPRERRCAALALAHAGTPALTHLDALGRPFLAIADNGPRGQLATRSALDIAGGLRSVTDARGLVILTHDNDLLGRPLRVVGADSGESRVLPDSGDKPRMRWDSDGVSDWRFVRHDFDEAQRPTHVYEVTGAGAAHLVERISYGEGHTEAEIRNLRGRAYQSYDGAGVVTAARFDFAGHLVESTRRLAAAYDVVPDWSALAAPMLTPAEIETAAAALLEPVAQALTTTSTFDALGRPVSTITPDRSETRPTYNDAGLLETVAVRVRGAVEWTTFVANIDYDARGQRRAIAYGEPGGGGPGDAPSKTAWTTYEYDPNTFRLISMRTTAVGGAARQALTYEYDPVGNIVEITDGVSHGNAGVGADGRYEYDALYQLLLAEGRDHPGQQPGPGDTELHPNDLQGLRRYRETFTYDPVGNFTQLKHEALDGTGATWLRDYAYVPGTNRLDATSAGGDPPGVLSARYVHDPAGNMIAMPHLRELRWDARDRLIGVRIDPDPAAADGVYFAYDGAGQRVRKTYRHGAFLEERIYLGGYEVYRKRRFAPGADPSPVDARETLHVSDGARRIALIETRTANADVPAAVFQSTTRLRFQLDNHLGSAVMELAASGAVIGYEEYLPYGGSAWSLPSGDAEVSARRYRYTGKERDDETGLYYYGARYFAAWLGRWTSADPAGFVDGPNLYVYVANTPIRTNDPTGKQGEDVNIDPETGLSYAKKTYVDFDDDPSHVQGGGPGATRGGEAEDSENTDDTDDTVADDGDFESVDLSDSSETEASTEFWKDVTHGVAGAFFGAVEAGLPFFLGTLGGWFFPSESNPSFHRGRAIGNAIVGAGQTAIGLMGILGGGAAAVLGVLSAPGTFGGGMVFATAGLGVAAISVATATQGVANMALGVHKAASLDANGQPKFKSMHDVRLPKEMLGPAIKDGRQMRAATLDLKLHLRKNPGDWKNFTPKQQKAMREAFGDMSKDTVKTDRIKGFTWHHDGNDDGILQLVDYLEHKVFHFGMRSATGGR